MDIKWLSSQNKGDEAVKQLAARFFSPWINIAVGESKDVRRKPNPDAVLQAIKQLGSNIEESIYVGDSEVDIATAKKRRYTMRCLPMGIPR